MFHGSVGFEVYGVVPRLMFGKAFRRVFIEDHGILSELGWDVVQGGVHLLGGKVSGVRGLGVDSGRFVVLEELVLGNE